MTVTGRALDEGLVRVDVVTVDVGDDQVDLQLGPRAHAQIDLGSRIEIHEIGLRGRALRSGAGELTLSAYWNGSAIGSGVARFAIEPPSPRPLRAREDVPSSDLRALASDSILQAVCFVACPREEVATLASMLWLPIVEEMRESSWARHFELRSHPHALRPGAKPIREQFPDAATLRDRLAARLEPWVLVSASAPSASGVVLCGEEAHAVAIDLALESMSPAKIAQSRDHIRGVIDGTMRTSGGLQAVLWRTGQRVSDPAATLYERVVGLDACDGLMERGWLGRWIRVPGNDTLWLGGALASSLAPEALGELSAIASVEPCGAGVRAELRAPSEVRRMESALEALLPSEGDRRAPPVPPRGGVRLKCDACRREQSVEMPPRDLTSFASLELPRGWFELGAKTSLGRVVPLAHACSDACAKSVGPKLGRTLRVLRRGPPLD